MAFNTNPASGVSAEINVTPLIDVLLVLLIIFMVIVPVMPRGLAALLPQPSISAPAKLEEPIMVQLESQSDGSVTYKLNQQSVTKQSLQQQLADLLARRRAKVIFVRGDRNLEFSAVAEVVAWGHRASADRIGILTPAAEGGN